MDNIDFENAFDAGLFDDEYMDFILSNADPTERVIHNGDTLLSAFEELYLFNEFRQYKLNG
jgi:hypothetical protein